VKYFTSYAILSQSFQVSLDGYDVQLETVLAVKQLVTCFRRRRTCHL